MSKIDSEGTFTLKVEESGVTLSKNGFPQWAARVTATRKYIEDAEGMKHFGLEAPAYVDWSSFGEEINVYLVLFKSKEEFSKDTALLNYEQLQKALGWDGTEFDSLGDGTYVGKEFLGRIQNHSYTNPETNKTTEGLQVAWIDAKDADPARSLKTLDASDIKSLTAKLKMGGITKAATPAKPAAPAKPANAAPTKPGKPSPAASPQAPAASPAVTTAAPSAATPATNTAPAPTAPSKAPPKKGKKAKEETAPAPAAEEGSLPSEATQAEAWEWLCNNKGENEDSVVEEAWIDACAEVGGDKDEDKFTPADWAKVRDLARKDLAL